MRTCIGILRDLSPSSRIYVWSDMFDPNHNAVAGYYLCNGTLADSFEGLNKDVIIVWHLPNNYGFCDARGDGVFLKDDDDGQFGEMYSTDDENGNQSSKAKCKKNYRWKDANTTTKGYEYKIIFHDSSGKTMCQLDPWIKNG